MKGIKRTNYSVPDDLAIDICKALGLDPNRVSRMSFDFEAGTGQPLMIAIEYYFEYNGGDFGDYAAEEVKSLEDLYHAYEG